MAGISLLGILNDGCVFVSIRMLLFPHCVGGMDL
jgi:hypothetical protein